MLQVQASQRILHIFEESLNATSGHSVNLVLYEEIYHGHERCKEAVVTGSLSCPIVLGERRAHVYDAKRLFGRSIGVRRIHKLTTSPSTSGCNMADRCASSRAEHPRYVEHNISNHQDIVGVMVVRRRDVHPTATREGAEDTNKEQESRDARVRAALQVVLESDESEARACERAQFVSLILHHGTAAWISYRS